jgi:hypothetical protein
MSLFYYDSDSNVYHNQLDAVASNKNCWLYFHDKEMAQVDWKTEPSQSLDQLYKTRAEYIRDNNKYVILCYSGGHDSTNILETFYYNNIHIDEILVVGALSQDSHVGSDENHNGELYKNVFPTLSKLNLPNTKITIVDYTKWFNDPKNFTTIMMYGNEWTKYVGGFKSVHTLFWRDLKKFIGHENTKQTAYIMGSDKVYLSYEVDKPSYVRFSDLSFFDYGSNYEDENFKRINFYTDAHPTATDITRKQAHLVNRFKKMNITHIGYDKGNILNRILYNLRHPLVYMSPKSIYTSISARDMFMVDAKNSEMYGMFAEGINNIAKYGSAKEKYNFWTKPYFIE